MQQNVVESVLMTVPTKHNAQFLISPYTTRTCPIHAHKSKFYCFTATAHVNLEDFVNSKFNCPVHIPVTDSNMQITEKILQHTLVALPTRLNTVHSVPIPLA